MGASWGRWVSLAVTVGTFMGCRLHQPERASTSVLPPCGESKPIIVSGRPTGFEKCSNGSRHRPSSGTCPSALPRSEAVVGLTIDGIGDAAHGGCRRDQDCSERLHGYCGFADRPPTFASCIYGCVRDDECARGQICLCGAPVGACVPAACRTDADCAPGYLCADYAVDGGECGERDAFACQSPRDTCVTTCSMDAGLCTFAHGRRTCSGSCSLE
jgi:hypothetical protein